MSLRGKAARGSLLLGTGEGVVYACSFVRNMVLARLLTKTDFGIAAAFAMIISLLELSARMGISRFVIRDKEGDDPEFIAAAHLAQFFAASLSALLLLGMAIPLATLFGIPDQTSAVMWLALVALFRAVEHLDVRRFERELRFGPSLLVEVIPQVGITLAAWPVAIWLGDYRAVLLLLILKALLTACGTHLFAARPYRWSYHPEYLARMLRFGWPLLVNGFLMFGVLQGNHFLVASFYSMADLGAFAAAAALTMAPTFFFGRVFNTVALPVLAKSQDDHETFTRRYKKTLGVVTLFSVAVSCGAILSAEALMRIVYGAKYAGAGVILAWLAAGNAFRNLRIAPSLAAIAKGDSKNEMLSNAWRLVAILPALWVAFQHMPIWWIACTGLLGESFACWIAFKRLGRRDGVPLSVNLSAAGCILALIAGAGLLALLGVWDLHPAVGICVGILGASMAAGVVLLMNEELRADALLAASQLKQAGLRRIARKPA